jgi:endonuclease III
VSTYYKDSPKFLFIKLVVVKILKHIAEDLDGNIPMDFNTWLNFYEIGPKTASLLFHASFGKPSTLPTDSHVWYAFQKFNWTNAATPDECSWQASRWMDPDYFVKTNDSIGSLRQILACNVRRDRLLHDVKQENNPRLTWLVKVLK